MTEEQIVSLVIKAIQQQQIPQPWYVQYNLVSMALVGAVGYIAWSAKTFFEKFANSIQDLYEKYNDVNDRQNLLQGSHDARTGEGIGCHLHKRKEDIKNG